LLSYNTELLSTDIESIEVLRQILLWERDVFNFASEQQFLEKNRSLVVLHSKTYKQFRKINPCVPSQVVIKGEQACLSAYKSASSNKHKLNKPAVKKRLSIRLDKRLYSKATNQSIRITTSIGRRDFNFRMYPKLAELLDKYKYRDPLVYENDGRLFISLSFEIFGAKKKKSKLAIGVDLGICRAAAISDGRIVIDKKFNADKRKTRFLKRSLQSCGTKSSRCHLKKIRSKERNQNKNQTHLIANEILKTNANTIVLENLKFIKTKKT